MEKYLMYVSIKVKKDGFEFTLDSMRLRNCYYLSIDDMNYYKNFLNQWVKDNNIESWNLDYHKVLY